MRVLVAAACALLVVVLSSCDLRSGTAKKEMERWESSPAPPPAAAPAPEGPPIELADIVAVDTTVLGEIVTVNGHDQKTSAVCSKLDQVMVNGNKNVVTVTGACRQIMINGDNNQITADAAIEFVFNGSANVLRHSRFVNGKRPIVKENQQGNVIEKIARN